MKGKFIALEGIDGCGKTTQIKYLSKWLPSSGFMPKNAKLHITREPGGTELGLSLRKLLLDKNSLFQTSATTELLLYAADRAQHISQLIAPAINKGDWVISDRFSGSTIAYQGYGRNLNIPKIETLEKIATDGILPDLTILLNIKVSTSITRRSKDIDDRIEAEGEDFLTLVSEGFNKLACRRQWEIIDAENDELIISKNIQKILTNHLTIN